MAIKKRNVASNETPRKSNQYGIKESTVPNKKLVNDKENQYEGGAGQDAFDRALAKASENKRRVEAIRVDERKAKPKVAEGEYTAITVDAQLEKNIESKYGSNDRVAITFEVFLDRDVEKSISLIEKFWHLEVKIQGIVRFYRNYYNTMRDEALMLRI